MTPGPYNDDFSTTLPSWAGIYVDGGMSIDVTEGVLKIGLSEAPGFSDFFVDELVDARARLFRTHLTEDPSTTVGEAVMNLFKDTQNWVCITSPRSNVKPRSNGSSSRLASPLFPPWVSGASLPF